MSSKVVKPAKAPKPAERPKPPAAGKGRVKGTPNKATTMAREAIAKLADGMTSEVQGWLRWVALGVGHAWVPWERPADWVPDHGLPEVHKLVGPAKSPIVLVPFPGIDRPVTLDDVANGTLPQGTVIVWVVPPDPDSAANTMLRALEYHIPKLGRIEHTDPDGKAIVPSQIVVVGVSAPERG